MADLEWFSFDPSDAIPSPLEPIIDGLSAAVSAIKTALEAVKAVFEVLKTLTIDRIDILKTALESIRNSIAALIESLEEAGIRLLVYVPHGFKKVRENKKTKQILGSYCGPVEPEEWVRRVVYSMTDPGDRNRPEFTTPQYQAGAILMAVGTDYAQILEDIKRLFNALFRSYDYRSLWCTVDNVDEDGKLKFPPFKLDKDCLRAMYGENAYRGQGVAPDWMKPILLKDLIPVFGQLAALLKKCLGLFVYGLGLTEILAQYIAFLEAKIAALEALAAQFDAILAIFAGLADIGGIHVLFFEGTYTTAELQGAILGVGLPPEATEDIVVSLGLDPEDFERNLQAIGLTTDDLKKPLAEIGATQAQLESAFGQPAGTFSYTPPRTAMGLMLHLDGSPIAETVTLLRGLLGA